MTRYTHLGKSTHQREADNPTSWDELKSTPHKNKNSSKNGREKMKRNFQGNHSQGRRNNRFGQGPPAEEVSANFTELGTRTSAEDNTQSKNVRGYGKSKVVKIFGQFWVPLEDGKRFQALAKTLREKGLSRKEILEGLRNERRKAEKAAKRIRDETWFGCRQFGHVLSDCPKASSTSTENQGDSLVEQQSQGDICFKCGSTEHTSRRCKKKGEKFNFAKCFVCSKVGHISRQCPDNTRGVYPSGGECNVCGELTHLAKDCPSAFGKPGFESGRKKKEQGEEAGLPVMSKLSDPFASTEYEPDTSFEATAAPPKKRRVKF